MFSGLRGLIGYTARLADAFVWFYQALYYSKDDSEIRGLFSRHEVATFIVGKHIVYY